ncbi:hypothetical protein D3C73_1154910 [compost metagenome]
MQGVQLAADGFGIERIRLPQLVLQPRTRGLHSQCIAAAVDIAPDHRGRSVPGECAITAVQQIVQCIEAGPELPVFASHEYPVDFRVETGDINDGGAVDLQEYGHLQTIALRCQRTRGLFICVMHFQPAFIGKWEENKEGALLERIYVNEALFK